MDSPCFGLTIDFPPPAFPKLVNWLLPPYSSVHTALVRVPPFHLQPKFTGVPPSTPSLVVGSPTVCISTGNCAG
ncbi:uncharacterized protein LACBIDRAFT_299136 [Laccaria bicolor S238N-H82]|uniref:Predicted protein n=1 Tax=Laccaria bicolor (strain S238N-H82 / ATCC MYA-4686) TaxID=486041 RepID=B0DE55_LACBS|nr:uncharacterized protein LACBIDRAFT_299136 [Laccaria bicolor S238N-H82]EDR07330.1 predicted protein [Laccaria bicolor S238N-H82]|eukprot:XP_001882261.1 predicted protein [Laccaria bicolor S238N-H82]